MKAYTEQDVLTWYEEYKNPTITARSISLKFKVKHETMIKHFKILGLEVREAGFRAKNSKGLYGKDLVKQAYIHQYNHSYKRRAARKGFEFSISEDESNSIKSF